MRAEPVPGGRDADHDVTHHPVRTKPLLTYERGLQTGGSRPAQDRFDAANGGRWKQWGHSTDVRATGSEPTPQVTNASVRPPGGAEIAAA